MKILVTGAKGQLGSDLAPRLKAAGFDALSLSSAELDIADGSAVAAAVKKERPGIIINSAAYTKVDLAEKERERAFPLTKRARSTLGRRPKKRARK